MMIGHLMTHPMTRRTAISTGVAAAIASAQAPASPKLGLIGLGNRSRRHFAAYDELDGIEVAALSDIQAERMRGARKGPAANATMYVDYRELIADKNVRVVVIATPNYLHSKMAIEAMKAGKDVILEKPLGLNYEQAREVAEAAKKYNRIIAVGMQRHYFAPYKKIIEYVNGGGLGKVHLYALNEYRGDWNPLTTPTPDPTSGKTIPWRHSRALAGSSLLEFSVHSYGFLHEMLRSPLTKCSATGGAVHWPERTTEDAISVIADYESGARLQHTYCGFAQGAQWGLTIAGDRGSLQYNRDSATVRRAGEDPFQLDLSDDETIGNEAQLYREFFQNQRTRTKSPLNADFALEAAKIAYAAWMSIDENRIITAKDFA